MSWQAVERIPNPWGQVPVSAGGQSLTPRIENYMERVRDAASRRDCPSRRHHYVPKAYLRACSYDQKRVRVLNTRNGDDSLQGVSDVCVRRDFYRVTDRKNVQHNQVEAMLAVIDDDTATLLNRLRAWAPGDDVDFDDFMALAVAAAMQRNRTPQARRLTSANAQWQTDRAGQAPQQLITDTFVDLLFRSRYEAADQLSTRQLELWDDPKGRFITSDQPVLLSESEEDLHPQVANGDPVRFHFVRTDCDLGVAPSWADPAVAQSAPVRVIIALR